MKTKFLLSLLALNGLLSAHSASATPSPSDTNHLHRSQIGQTISELIGLDANDRILVGIAIDRALIAQAAPRNLPTPPMITAGAPLPSPPQQPTIRGRTTKPTPQSIDRIRKSPDRPSPPTTPK